MEDRYYLPREVAELLHMDIKTVYRKILRGQLRSVRRGPNGRHLIPASALAEFLRPAVPPVQLAGARQASARHESALEACRKAGLKV